MPLCVRLLVPVLPALYPQWNFWEVLRYVLAHLAYETNLYHQQSVF